MTRLPDEATGRAPLTPPELDLRDFPFMPLEINRLFGSQFHALTSDAEWRAGVTLWLKSYHQVPGASVPDDDIALARLAEFGRDLKSWRKVRAAALRGWVRCCDGRLYHPVVAEKALEGWLEKLRQRRSSGSGNARRWGAEFDAASIDAAIATATEFLKALNPRSRALARRAPAASRRDEIGTAPAHAEPIAGHSQDKRRDVDDDTRRHARGGLISVEAFAVADRIEKACGFNSPRDAPVGWAGCAMWVQKCLHDGWIGDVMVEAARVVSRRKRNGVIESFKYLEKPLAQAMAEHRAPLPQVEIVQPDKLKVIANEKSESLARVAARLAEAGVSFAERPRGLRLDEGGGDVRQLPEG